ncbi:MAG TPA: type VII secretion protein EccE [Mycobacterium sp.]
MSPRFALLWPGPARITLVMLAVIPAAMAYPWPSTRDRWLLGVAAAVLVVLLGRWRGLYLTTIVGRRAAMSRQRSGKHADQRYGPDVRATALLRVVPPVAGPGLLPLSLIAGYLNRYGLRAHSIRITSRDTRSAEAAGRDTWIGLTLSAAENLAALQARSSRIPLAETAEVAARRLADHLRESGWATANIESAEVPMLFGADAAQSWDGLTDGEHGHIAAYQVDVDHTLSDTLADVWAYGAPETWTVLEITGAADRRTVAAGCALRTRKPPVTAGPLPGLVAQAGNHRRALQVLHPLSGVDLQGHTEFSADDLAALRWPAAQPAPVSRT